MLNPSVLEDRMEAQIASFEIQNIPIKLLARLVGNEGINLYIGILGIHSLIPY